MNALLKGVWFAALIALTACVSAGRMWPEQTGIVLDEKTQQPIEGAIVVARWIGTISQLVDSQTTCYHVESATTDAQGRYRIPAWTKLPGKVGHNELQFTVYKAGYRRVRALQGVQYLERDVSSVDDRLKYLSIIAVTCGMQDESKEKLLPLYRALHAEAKEIAVTKEQKIKALHRLKTIELIEVGSDEAWRRFYQRERELK